MKYPLWLHRLYGQQADPNWSPMRGADLGLAGTAAQVEINDQFQAEAIAAAPAPLERLRATCEYLRKVLRNIERGREETGDRSIEQRVEDTFTTLTEQLLIGIADIKAELVDLAELLERPVDYHGYPDEGVSP